MNIESLRINTSTQRRDFSGDQVIAALDGSGGRSGARTTMTLSYVTPSDNPEVWYTSLDPDGLPITPRTQTGVSLSPCGDWTYVETVTGLDQFVAVWDEGNENDFIIERIMVDT